MTTQIIPIHIPPPLPSPTYVPLTTTLPFAPPIPNAALSPFHTDYFTRIITLYHHRLCSTWTSLTGLPPPAAAAKPPTITPLTLATATRILTNFREHQRWFRTISVAGEGVWPLSDDEREHLSLRVVREYEGGLMGFERRETALVEEALELCFVLKWTAPIGYYEADLRRELERVEREQRMCHGRLRLLWPLWREKGLV